jgi:hypothetical protein
MSSFFSSLKADLLDRRLTPILALLGLALVGAFVYAAMAGGSSSSTIPSAAAPAPSTKTAGIAVSAVSTDATTASAAETTSGSAQQTGGSSHNPFAPLPSVKKAAKAAAAAAATGESNASTGSGSAGAGAGGKSSTGSETPSSSESNSSQGNSTSGQEKSSKPKKRKPAYAVSVLFGTAPPATPLLDAELKTYEDLKRQQPLPSATQPLIVYRGVIAGGESVTFTLVGEAILRGNATCLPNASQCQAIDLKPGDTEELEYVPLGGTAVTYQLHVVSITPLKAKAASKLRLGDESKVGLKLLHAAGLSALPGLRYSHDGSVLVFAGSDHAFAARAHASAWGLALKG